jgi:hypothetical protein
MLRPDDERFIESLKLIEKSQKSAANVAMFGVILAIILLGTLVIWNLR